jgi:hypothetical protein
LRRGGSMTRGSRIIFGRGGGGGGEDDLDPKEEKIEER